MHPRLKSPLSRSARLRVLGVLAVAVAALASVTTQARTQPSVAAGQPVRASTTERVARPAELPVELHRHHGTVLGDGHTRYLANRTEFRPRRTVVALPPRVRAGSWAVVDLGTGRLLGDGHTRYLANRTEFRPRRTVVALPPRLRAGSWAVVDLGTGRLLGEHNARQWRPQASTMKLLTAVTAARVLDHQALHKVTRFEAHQMCTCAGLAPGHPYSFQTLMEGMLLPSGNDAAEALAGADPKGRTAFYAAMNRTAHRLGATDTVAKNASGLTAEGSHSSARDLVVLLRAALRRPATHRVLAMRSAHIESADGRRGHTVWRGTDYVNLYPHALGKSGYTTPAGNTLVVATRIGGHHIAVSVMHAPYGYVTSDARRLTEWAAVNFRGLRSVGRLPHS